MLAGLRRSFPLDFLHAYTLATLVGKVTPFRDHSVQCTTGAKPFVRNHLCAMVRSSHLGSYCHQGRKATRKLAGLPWGDIVYRAAG